MNKNPLHIINDGGGKECQLMRPPLFQCCCTCAYRVPIYHHCCTRPRPVPLADGVCQCGVQKGWACVGALFDGGNHIFDNWMEHSGGCELHTPKSPDLSGKHIRQACQELGIDWYEDLDKDNRFFPDDLKRITEYLETHSLEPNAEKTNKTATSKEV